MSEALKTNETNTTKIDKTPLTAQELTAKREKSKDLSNKKESFSFVESIEDESKIDIPDDVANRVTELSKNKIEFEKFKSKIKFLSKSPNFNLAKFVSFLEDFEEKA